MTDEHADLLRAASKHSASRRRFVGSVAGGAAALTVATLAPVRLRAQPSARSGAPPSDAAIAAQLPLDPIGMEHVGTVVPDVTASARFFARVFNPFVYQEKDPPLRYYVTLDPGYIAVGSRDGVDTAFIDHDCVYAESYDRAAMAARLEREGLPAGRFGIIPDPDDLGLQLLPIGGLAATTEPAGALVPEAALVRPRGLYRVLRHVSDLDRSTQFYRHFFGMEVDKPEWEGVWFAVGPTYFGLRQAAAGEPPRIDRFCVNIAAGGFDPEAVGAELTRLGASVSTGEEGMLAFRSPAGIGVELRPVDPARIWGRA